MNFLYIHIRDEHTHKNGYSMLSCIAIRSCSSSGSDSKFSGRESRPLGCAAFEGVSVSNAFECSERGTGASVSEYDRGASVRKGCRKARVRLRAFVSPMPGSMNRFSDDS